jgi:hypothetical protein
MLDVIARLYASGQQASEAVAKLQAAGFRDDSIGQLQPAPERDGEEGAPEAAPAPGNDLERRMADVYGDQVAKGRSVVAVAAPFGRGKLATAILDNAGPVDEPLPSMLATEPMETALDPGEAAPLSRLLGLRVLSSKAAPLSAMMNWPVKSDREYFLTSGLRNEAAPLSGKVGLPTLTKRRHFLVSSLWNKAAPLSSATGVRVRSDNPAPLSARFGWPLLKNNPTPLSSRFGWRVLSEKQ